jgi:peptidyl-prolyl cis-trans isomerase D
MKAKLETDLKAQRVEQRFVEATKQLEDAAFESSDLAQPAQELGLKVQTSEPFGRQGGQGIASNRQVLQAAFSQEVMEDGSNSGAIELDPNTLVVIRVKEHRKPQQLELDQVADSIRAQLTKTRASEAAKAAGEQLVSELRDGKAKPEGAEWQVVEAATRNQDGVDPAVLQALFRMPKPTGEKSEFSGIALANGDYAVIRLKGVSEPEQALSDEEKAMYRRFLASRSGQEDFAAYRKQLESKADIERF